MSETNWPVLRIRGKDPLNIDEISINGQTIYVTDLELTLNATEGAHVTLSLPVTLDLEMPVEVEAASVEAAQKA